MEEIVKDLVEYEISKLSLETRGIGAPPDLFGVEILLRHNGTIISQTIVNLFDNV